MLTRRQFIACAAAVATAVVAAAPMALVASPELFWQWDTNSQILSLTILYRGETCGFSTMQSNIEQRGDAAVRAEMQRAAYNFCRRVDKRLAMGVV